MNRIVYLLTICMLVVSSCKETVEKNEDANAVPEGAMAKSSGRFNHLTVVMENDLWEGEVGEIVRKHLAAPVDGLPQEEPGQAHGDHDGHPQDPCFHIARQMVVIIHHVQSNNSNEHKTH